MPIGENNPFSFAQVKRNIRESLYKEGFTYGENYSIIEVPNIVNIGYGRDVGYSITQYDLGEEIHKISATEIRNASKS